MLCHVALTGVKGQVPGEVEGTSAGSLAEGGLGQEEEEEEAFKNI